MNQVMPVLFFAWVNSHRAAAARIGDAMYFHVRDLPHFRDHLNDYLGPTIAVLPQGCPPRPRVSHGRNQAINQRSPR
jgi:hypothetical protein